MRQEARPLLLCRNIYGRLVTLQHRVAWNMSLIAACVTRQVSCDTRHVSRVTCHIASCAVRRQRKRQAAHVAPCRVTSHHGETLHRDGANASTQHTHTAVTPANNQCHTAPLQHAAMREPDDREAQRVRPLVRRRPWRGLPGIILCHVIYIYIMHIYIYIYMHL